MPCVLAVDRMDAREQLRFALSRVTRGVRRVRRRLVAARWHDLPRHEIPPEVTIVLDSIPELGFVRFAGGRVAAISPRECVLPPELRWEPTVDYLAGQALRHPGFAGEYFVCVYDGWREYSGFVPIAERKCPDWLDIPDRDAFLCPGDRGEPRFRHVSARPEVYPRLPRRVIAYNRHVDDDDVVLIPDAEYLATGFRSFRRQVRAHDVAWLEKRPQAVWRGSRNVTVPSTYHDHGTGPKHPRDLAVEFGATYPDVLDASFERTTIADQLRYRYILDLDGAVSAWSATYWKLLSNSVMLKYRSHWEGWYHRDLKPWVHYVPFESFHELPAVVGWCREHDDRCRSIATAATEFARRLSPTAGFDRVLSSAEIAPP
jgi:hypothetical protein